MAPQYAPSLRSRLGPILLFMQIGFIVIFAFYIEIDNDKHNIDEFKNFYPDFQDVQVVVFLGFGFLYTSFVRCGFSGVGFSFLAAVFASQWAILLNGIMESWYTSRKIGVNLRSLVVAELCASSALISIGTMVGKTNPVQLILLTLMEVSGFVLNHWCLQTMLKIQLLNSIMMLHIFGAFYGLMLTLILHRTQSEQQFEKEKFDRKTGLFSMLGALFLWMFWPSFNSILVGDHHNPGRKLRAVFSTYLALAVSAVTAAAVSVLSSPKGKFNPIHIQSCIFAGGVAIGLSMSVVYEPWQAMTIGFTAAVVSTIGFRYLKMHMLLGFHSHDSYAILSTHGLPGLLGWLVHLLLQIKDCGDETTAIRFAVLHICSLLFTISLSLSMGIITGLLLKWNFWRPPQDTKCFEDQAFWEFPHNVVRK